MATLRRVSRYRQALHAADPALLRPLLGDASARARGGAPRRRPGRRRTPHRDAARRAHEPPTCAGQLAQWRTAERDAAIAQYVRAGDVTRAQALDRRQSVATEPARALAASATACRGLRDDPAPVR